MRREVHTTDAGAAHAHADGKQARVADARRGQLAVRVEQFRRSRRTGLLGVPEIIALVVACALLAVAAASYFLLLVPARSNLTSLERDRQQLQAQIRSAGESREHDRSTGETADRIKQSLVKFESESLDPRDPSNKQLIEELNEKIARNKLARAQFTFIYQDDTQAGATQQAQQRAAGNLSGSARRRQTVFPATDISLTIEGTYANLRHFIRDVETSPRFVVINGVQLEGMNETGGDPTAARGALVSLRLDLSAYFRRSSTNAAAAASAEQSGATAATRTTSH